MERLVDFARKEDLLAEAYSITGIEPQMSNNSLGDLHNHYNTLIDAAIFSANFRSKIFEPSYPIDMDEISAKVGYMNSPIDINTAIKGGFYSANFIGNYIDNYFTLEKGAGILDFECGSLRVSRYFMQFVRQFVYFACDVNPISIRWAQEQFRDRGNIWQLYTLQL